MRTVTAAVMVLLLVATVSTEQQRPQDVELQAAIRTATVDGDLDKAAKLFSGIAETYKTDRSTAATALLHLADVYQKRGDAQARAVYERILREFPDQRDAATTARTRLGDARTAHSMAMSYRQLWTGPKVDGGGSVSPDGRLLAYSDWETGDLAVHDLIDGTDRRITGKKGGWQQSEEYAETSVFSRDGRSIAYAWFDGKNQYELRVADLSSTPARVRTLYRGEWLAPHDWSPDGTQIAVSYNASKAFGSTRLGTLAVTDGSLRELRSPSNALEAFFSPDGRYLLFDEERQPPSGDRDVYVMSLENRTAASIAPNDGYDRAMGWSGDGTRALFASDRRSTVGLWAQAVSRGRPQGAPDQLKSEIGDASLGLSASGALFVATTTEGRSVFTAQVDFATGRVTRPAERLADRYFGMHEWPDWSPDGKFISFVYARNWSGRVPTIGIRALDTGAVREVPFRIRNSRNPLWAPDGKTFVVSGVGPDNKRGLYEIDVQTGAMRTLAQSEPGEFFTHPEYSPDGKTVYFAGRRGSDQQNGIYALDRTSAGIRLVLATGRGTMVQVSPDGTSLAWISRTSPETDSVLKVTRIADGQTRDVATVSSPQVFTGNASWAPDGRALMVNTFWSNSDRRETWLIPVAGGEHKVLDLPGQSWGRIRVHPDGKTVAYHAGNLKTEVWVLEHFLPVK